MSSARDGVSWLVHYSTRCYVYASTSLEMSAADIILLSYGIIRQQLFNTVFFLFSCSSIPNLSSD